MDIELLSRMVGELIVDHDMVGLPGVGTFVAEVVPASFSDKGYTINPPYRRLSFHPSRGEEDLLVDLYSTTNGINREAARIYLTQFLLEMKTVLKDRKTIVFPGLGRMRATKENNFFFIQDQEIDVFPEGYALPALSLKALPDDSEPVRISVPPIDLAAAMQTEQTEQPNPSEQPEKTEQPEQPEPAIVDIPADVQEEDAGQPVELLDQDALGIEETAAEVPVPETMPVEAETVLEFAEEPEPSESAESASSEPDPIPESAPSEPAEPEPSESLAPSEPEPLPEPSEQSEAEKPVEPAPVPQRPVMPQSTARTSESHSRSHTHGHSHSHGHSHGRSRSSGHRTHGHRWWIPVIVVIALAAVAFAVFLILASVAPDFIDSILYTPEELRIINY